MTFKPTAFVYDILLTVDDEDEFAVVVNSGVECLVGNIVFKLPPPILRNICSIVIFVD